jgi:RNA polymerase sigma-B factor
MVRSVALQYKLPTQYYEDLIQAGYVGLVKAINNFDPAISEDLKPYAHACVAGEIKRFFRDKRWLIRVSRSDQELLLRAKRAQAELTAELGTMPTDDQVAGRLNVSGDDLRRAYQANNAFAPDSLDEPISGSDQREKSELIGAHDTRIDYTVDMQAVRQHWAELPWTQGQILLMRFYGNMTQQQVADRLHCSQMHVSRSQTKALVFLRGRLLAD